ncbi:MAG TPA: bifunctional DNA-binding transcriptional regulator/O6-methylguanine-DNA methyltransferase Ada [Thermoanaerobaculia bacterium]|nr:bifunctional DNA-binding transcriptional regulator/O6-methylguanine-DNA methyltransferase Ada [Thermoanaerobaculia bacterium]
MTQSPFDADLCWQAVLSRDRSEDGHFFLGVLTTGIFCRPSCPARRPKRENVRFYPSPEAARRDGLRPCKRCRPEAGADPRATRIEELCAHIRAEAGSGEPLTLEALAERAGMSPSHFQRTFREVVGVTPRQFVEACRLEALKQGLKAGESVTDAIYDAGFGSASRVYERTDTRLGMTPGAYRAGGKGVAISWAATDTPLGRMMIAATDRGLCFVQFGESDQALLERLRAEYPAATLEPSPEPRPAAFEGWMAALRSHLEGLEPLPELPLDVRASAFQLMVWRYLQSIPRGEVRSYSEVAQAIGRPKAARAVARACATNRAALVVPCHRVIRGDGDLGGYRWGLERKQRLLAAERGGGGRRAVR